MKQLIDSTPSTNTLLAQQIAEQGSQNIPNLYTIYTHKQTAGRGQQGNTWESEPYKNLTFSTLFHLQDIPIDHQFILSQLVTVAIKNVLDNYTDHIKIKWPNDIYYQNSKLAGILIEHSIIDSHIDHSIVGIGLNVNQTIFRSDAPNPISLKQITHHNYDLEQLLDLILQQFDTLMPLLQQPETLHRQYMQSLYRTDDYYTYRTPDGTQLKARITHVAPNGIITLTDTQQHTHQFHFKQIAYII